MPIYYLHETKRFNKLYLQNIFDLVYIKIIDKINGFFKVEYQTNSSDKVINYNFVKQNDLLALIKGIVYNGI